MKTVEGQDGMEKRIIWIATGLKYTQRGNGKRRDRPSQSILKKEADLLDKLTLAGVRLDVRLPWETEQMNEQRWEREREREGAQDRRWVVAVHETALTPLWLATLDLRPASRYDWHKYG